MAITECVLHWSGSTGSHDRTGGEEYTAIYRATTDDAQEQAQTVINWFRANVVNLGVVYSYAADTAASEAISQRIRAKRYLGGSYVWEVQVDYAPPTEESGIDSDGNPTSNPLNFRPQIHAATVQYSRLVEKSEFLGGYKGLAAALLPDGTKTMPQNSAFVPFSPARERDDSRLTIRVIRNMPTFDGDAAEEVADTVNSERIRFNYLGFTADCPPKTLKVREFSSSLRYYPGPPAFVYWETEIALDRDKNGWAEEIADRGFHARAHPGDPDGRGGTISASDVIPGLPMVRRLVDHDETPVSAEVLLDGDGMPLDTSIGPVEAVYGKWLHYDQGIIKDLPVLAGIVS